MRLIKHLNEATGKTPFLHIVQVLQAKSKLYLIDMARTGHAHELYSGRSDNRDMYVKAVRTDRTPMDTPTDVSDTLDEIFYRKFRWRPRSNSIFVTSRLSTAESYGSNVYMIFPVGRYQFLWHNRIKDLWTEIEDSDAVSFYKGDEPEPDPYERENVFNNLWQEFADEYERKNTEPEESDFEDDEGEVDDAAFEEAYDDWRDAKEEYAEERANDAIQDWEDDWRSNLESESYSYFSDLVHGYKDRDLTGAIKWQGEIMLGCKEYIAVSRKHYVNILQEFIPWFDWKKVPTQQTLIDFKASPKGRLFTEKELGL